MTTLVDKYRKEYDEGWDAGLDRKDIIDCPYEIGSSRRVSWMLGYSFATFGKRKAPSE